MPSRGARLCKGPEVENQLGDFLEQPDCCVTRKDEVGEIVRSHIIQDLKLHIASVSLPVSCKTGLISTS